MGFLLNNTEKNYKMPYHTSTYVGATLRWQTMRLLVFFVKRGGETPLDSMTYEISPLYVVPTYTIYPHVTLYIVIMKEEMHIYEVSLKNPFSD